MIDLDGEITRYNFNTTVDSLITMFIVLTGENWNWVMTTVIYAHPDKEMLAIFFFVTAMLIGNFMLLNLFLAILLKFLQDAVEDLRKVEEEERKAKQEAQLKEDKEKAIEISKKAEKDF